MTSDEINHDHRGPMCSVTAPGSQDASAAMTNAPMAAVASQPSQYMAGPSLGLKDSGPGRAGSQTPMAWCVIAPSRATARSPWIIEQYDHHEKAAFACQLLHVAGGCPVGFTNGAMLDKIEWLR